MFEEGLLVVYNVLDLLEFMFPHLQDCSSRIGQLESDAREYEEGISKLKAQVFQEQQKVFDCESECKENVARLEAHNKALNTEVRGVSYRENPVFKI